MSTDSDTKVYLTGVHFVWKIQSAKLLDSIAVSLFVDWLSLSNTESEANPNNNLMMRRAGLSTSFLCWPDHGAVCQWHTVSLTPFIKNDKIIRNKKPCMYFFNVSIKIKLTKNIHHNSVYNIFQHWHCYLP